MAAKQIVTKTKTVTHKTSYKGLAAIAHAASKPKRGRPVGSKDTKPRKTRSDKGKARGAYKKRAK